MVQTFGVAGVGGNVDDGGIQTPQSTFTSTAGGNPTLTSPHSPSSTSQQDFYIPDFFPFFRGMFQERPVTHLTFPLFSFCGICQDRPATDTSASLQRPLWTLLHRSIEYRSTDPRLQDPAQRNVSIPDPCHRKTDHGSALSLEAAPSSVRNGRSSNMACPAGKRDLGAAMFLACQRAEGRWMSPSVTPPLLTR